MSLLGFNEAYYLAAKLHALQADSKTSSEWGVKNIDDLKVALAENGFTAETHYMTWGWQEHLVPNEYFNADEYSLNKATQLYHDSPDIYPSIAAAEAAFKAAWPGDVYQHYIEYGISEGISPSNSNVSNSNAEPLVITATGVQGFDETYYLGVKLKSLQAQFSEWVVKDTADLKTALADAGFTPETHYMTWGWQEHLAPNEYFNAAEYARAVATNRYNESLFNHTNTYASIDAAEAAFKAEYTGDMYQHYLQDGSAKDINPSNSFDASFYYASKLVQLQADNATKAEWSTKTVDDVKAAILGNGMTALSHYEMYGKTEGVAVTPVPAAERVFVGGDSSVPVVGHTFTLTESVISETTADSITAITPTIKYITYVGYNPHLHLDTTSVNGTDTGVNNQAGNTNNQTNEGPVDGGIPLYDLNAAGDPATGTDVVQKGMVSYIKDLTGLDFIELGLIDVADTVYGTGNAADLSNMTFTNATTGTQTITINTGDGTVNTAEVSISQEYFALLHDMFFDAEGNSRLYEVERKTWPKVALTDQNGNTVKDSAGAIILVDLYQYTSHGVTTHTYPIVLTTEHNNGGTLETGLTSNGDDTIVAGRLELLHQAYIDGGAGHNILEIDAKGTYAQPAELLNIQEVRVHDLPNFYTIASGDGNLENTAVNGTGFLNPVNTASGSGDDSWIDLTRATAIEKLVVTDGTNGSGGSGSSDPDYSGNLTIVGVRNGATLRLEGAFNSGSTTIQYGEGQTGPLEIELAIGDVKTPIILLQNAAVLHIDSQGVENHMHVFFAGGTVSQMIITGTGAFGVEEDLHAGFNTEQPILIDASANTGGVNLNLTGSQNVTFKGSIADDTFRVNTAEMSNPSPNGYFAHENDHSVTIVDTAGDNHYEVSTYAAAITANGDGNNNFEVSAAVADLKAGDGNNDFELSVGALTLEAGNGNNTVEIVSDYISSTTAPSGSADVVSNIDITFGNGKNVIDVEQDLASTYEGHVNITVGDGGNDIDVVGGRNVAITTGSGDDLIRVVTDKLTINSGAGNDTITIVGADTDYTATYGDGLLFNINTGTGSATINLGSTQSEMNPDGVNDFPYDGYVVAHEGSSITGADITLFVNTIADLSAIKPQNLTGVTKVILDDDNSLYSGSPQANDNTTSATFTALVTSYNAALTAYTTLSDSTTQAQLVQKYDDLDKLISGLTHSDGLDAVTGDTAAQALAIQGLETKTQATIESTDVRDRAMLTLTDEQFKALGAEKFSVDGSIFNTHAYVKIIVTEPTTLETLLGGPNVSLPRNIDLYLELNDGVTLTMTAKELHTYVAQSGITLAHDGNTDLASGKVVITDGGLNFDPFNTSDNINTVIAGHTYYGGSLSATDFAIDGSDEGSIAGNTRSEWYNVTVQSKVNGWNRPADDAVEVVLTLDSTGSLPFSQAAFTTSMHSNLNIIGDQDINFTGDINLGEQFTIDFKELQGNVNNLTIAEFQDVKEIRGNGGATVYVKLENSDNTDDLLIEHKGPEGDDPTVAQWNAALEVVGGLKSSGVKKYIVTDIADNEKETTDDTSTAQDETKEIGVIHLCDQTEDLEVIGLRGNYNATLVVNDVPWGVNFELQGGSTLKADGPTATSNIGALVATYEWPEAVATVNITHSVTADTRPFKAYGITINKAEKIIINVSGADATIDKLDGNGISGSSDYVKTLDINSADDVSISSILPTSVEILDATGVTGLFAATVDAAGDFTFDGAQGGNTLTIADEFVSTASVDIDGGVTGVHLVIASDLHVDLSHAGLHNVKGIVIDDDITHTLDGAENSVTLNFEQLGVIGASNITVKDAGDQATLNLADLDDQLFTPAVLKEGIHLGTITLLDKGEGGEITLNQNTDLTGFASLTVPKGMILNLSAKQFKELGAAGAIKGADIGNPDDFTVNITGLTQEDVDNGFDTHSIKAGTITITLAEDVVFPADSLSPAVVTDLTGVDTLFVAHGLTLTLPTLADADAKVIAGGIDVDGKYIVGGTLVFAETEPAVADNPLTPSVNEADLINASGFHVNTLKFTTTLISDSVNVDYLFKDLPVGVEKVMYNGIGDVALEDQTYTMNAGTTTMGDIVFNKTETNAEIEDFILNLNGGTNIQGNLILSSEDKAGKIHSLLKSVTINSYGTEKNLLSNENGAFIDGITSQAEATSGGTDIDNNLLKVTINADQSLTIRNGITFESVVVTGDYVIDKTDAVAELTVTGSADVHVGYVDISDTDVDGLNVVNNGTGTLSITIDADKINDETDNIDALSFTGTGHIVLTTVGSVDLSDDTLTAVTAIKVVEGAELILSFSQYNAITPAGFSVIDSSLDFDTTIEPATLTITGYDGTAFDATALSAKFTTVNLTLTDADVDLTASAVDLTGVDMISVAEGRTLTLSAAQFQELQGNGAIVGYDTNGIEETSANPFKLIIKGLTQADVEKDDSLLTGGSAGFSLAGVQSNADVTITLGENEVTLGKLNNTTGVVTLVTHILVGSDTITDVKFELADGQTLNLVNATQANGLTVNSPTGATNTTLVLKFDDLDTLTTGLTQINAAGYHVNVLKALETFVQGENVEELLLNVPSSTVEHYYTDPLDLDMVKSTLRVAVVEAGVTVDGFLMYNDLQNSKEVRTLDLTLAGGSKINGDVDLSTTLKSVDLKPQTYLESVTIHSSGANANTITGSIIAVDPDGAGSKIENNLLNITIDATQTLTIGGDLVFTSVATGTDKAAAELTITGSAAVTVQQLDVKDAQIDSLTIANNGTGTFTVTGASPALFDDVNNVADPAGTATGTPNLETLTLKGTGNIVLGSNAAVTTEWGITAANLSKIDASALSGNLDLGLVKDIDSDTFEFIAGSGVTKLTLAGDTLVDGADVNNDAASWSFDFTTAKAGSELHLGLLGAAVSNTYGVAVTDVDGIKLGDEDTLNIKLGDNTTLYIDANTDFTNIESFSLTGVKDIVLADGVTLTLTAAQANGLHIKAGVDTFVAGITAQVNVVGLGDTPVDLSHIATEIAGNVELADDDVTLGVYDSAGNLTASTNLGDFTVVLNSRVDAGGVSLVGQTVRFATVEQADNAVRVINDADDAAGVNSTNVVWLFGSVAVPVNTTYNAATGTGYDPLLGRLWISEALANGTNVEQLFTSLPESIVRVDFSSIEALNVLLPSSGVNRTVELVAFTQLANGLSFSDHDKLEHVHNLIIEMGGSVSAGNLAIDNVVNPTTNVDLNSITFDTLTINSMRALHEDHHLAPDLYVNDNDGVNDIGENEQPVNLNTIGNITVGSNNGLDLKTVILNTYGLSSTSGAANAQNSDIANYNPAIDAANLALSQGAALKVGKIVFDAEVTGQTATLDVNGANNVTIETLDTSDAQISSLVVNAADHSAVLLVTGGSPAAAVANTETLTINPGATGTIYFGYEEVKTGDVVTGYILHTDAATGKPYAGVAGADLSNITVDSSGEVYLGVIGLIDSTDDVGATTTTKAFTLVGNGHTFAQLGEANVDGVIQHPVLAAGSRWAIQDATIKLTDKVTLGAGQLSLTNVSLIVEGNVDFTTLTRDNLTTATVDEEGLTLAGTTTIDVPTGSTLKILAEDASGLTITGGGTVTIEDLELIPDADLSNIMTNEGDTGHVIAIVDTTDTILDDNTTPDTITFAVTAELGIAEVHVIGGGILDATNVLVANMTATIDRDPSAVVTEETVLASFVVEGTSTLVLTAAQGDDRTVTGTGTTNVEDISLVATGLNNTLPLALNLASVNSGTVNIAVDNNATLDRFDNLGTPGATRVITIKGEASTEVDNVGVTLTAAGSVISGQYIIGGNNATVVVDDQNDGAIPAVAPSVTPTDTPITADLRHVSVEYINLVDGAAVGTIQFPTLYGDPVKKYIDDGVLPVNNGGDLKVAVQTVTLTAAQANGQTITGIDLDGAGSGVALGGEVIVNKLGEALVDLSLIQAGKQTAHVPDQTLLDPNDWIYMAAGTKLGLFDVVLDNNTVKLDLSAAQANGRNITDGSNTAWINVYGLEALPAVDLSKVVVTTITDGHEAATLDLTNGDVTFTGNLGAGFIVTVTDDDAPVDNTLTFNGSMESDKTSFDLADDVKLVIDAAKANLLHVTDDTTNNGIANTSVTVNNLGSAQVDFTHIDGNNLVVNVPVDVTLNAATVIDTGYTGAGYSAIPGVATDGTPGAAEYTVFTVMETMQAGDTLTIDGLTITATTNVDIDTIVNTLANLGDNVPADSGLTISGGYVTPAGWTGTPTVVGNTGANTVTFTNTVLGDVTNFTASTGFVTTTNNFHVVLAEGVDLGLTVGQLLDIDESDISGTAGGVSETLIVSGYTGIPAQDIQSDELGANVVISKLIVTGGTPLVTNNVVVSPNADLTKVLEIVVPQYTTLTMTADQFQQLLGNAGVTVSGGGILNLTNFDNTNATINLSTVTAVAGTILLDPLATSDVILPILTDGVVVVDPLAKLDTATGDKFDFLFSAANQSLTLSSETQADGRVVTDLGVANSKLVLGFINDDVTDANAIIESAGFHVDNLWVINKYIENEFGIVTPVGSTGNFEYFLNNLDESVLVTVVDVDTLLANNLSYPGYIADPTDRVVDIAHDTGLSANVAFSDLAVGEEVGSLYLTLRGNSTISGNLALPQYKDPQTSIATPNSATMPHFFESLTIESNNTVRNADGTFSAAGGADPGPNEITGSIFADNGADLTESTAEVFTLTLNPGLTIDGAQDQIFFDGEVVTLINGNNADAVAARIAAAFPASAVGTHWTATASNNVVTFTNKDVGNVVTDVALSNFTFVKNGVLTANLTGVVAKVNDGSVVGNENNLTNVTIVADHELLIGGEIEFRYVTRSSDGSMIPTTDEHAATTTAVLTIDGNAHVQIGALNTDDAHITGLAIDHTGAGVVDIVGTSPAAAVSNTEQLIINNNGGLINFGTGNGTTTLATTKPGVSGSALSLIDVNGSGDVDLKVIADVDSNGGTNGGFTLDATGSDGNVTAIITDDLTGGTWNFLNGEDGTLNLTIRGDGTAPTGVDGADFTSGTLNLNGVTLILDGNVDLSDITLSIIGGTVNLTADSSLTVTCAQADTLAITGAAGSTIYVVDAESGDIFEGLNVPNINLLGITSTDPLDIPASTVVLDNSHFGAATQSYNIIGSNFADAIIGGSLADTISGGLGNDTITAGTATGDTILVTGGTDTITDLSAIGSDTITTNDDVLVVSGTASATANNVSQFIATAGTSNTSSGTVILNGTAVADTINMTLATGTAGYVINGNAGADTLTGSNFADSITGGADVDSLIGGLGNDTIGGADTDALIDGDNGTVSGGGTADVLQVVGDFIYGTDANLRNVEIVNQTVTNHTINLTGQTESFTINGTVFIADDLVSNPTVAGQSGDDTIVGGSGNDTINSLSGNDNLFGGAGNDSIVAGDGNDQLTGGAGIDNLNGGNGIDLFAFGNSEFVAGETIDGGANTDTLLFTTADHAAFTVTNGDGNGLTTYETLAFTILPNGQVLNAGQSIAIAGRTVTATADGMTGANVATLFNGTAVTGLTIAPASFTTPANWTGVVAASAVGNVFTLRNTDFINVGTALPVSGTLGETINDAAFANKTGLEVIDLGDGTNSLTLGTIAAAATATPTVYGGTGVDTVNASTLGEAVTIEGNAGNDVLTGSALADSILGEAGADTITGGAGVDNLSGGTEADLFVFGNGEFVAGETVDGGADTDTIRLADAQTVADATFTNKTTLEKIEMGNGINSLTLGINAAAATATLTVTGGTGADTVNASALGEALTIDGGTGNDILTGSSATDLIVGGEGDDTFNYVTSEFVAAETVQGGLGNDTIRFTNVAQDYAVTPSPTDGGFALAEAAIFTITQVMNAGQSLTINGLTVTATADGIAADQVALAFSGTAVAGLTLSGTLGTPTNWTGTPVLTTVDLGATGTVTLTNTVFGNVTNFIAYSTGSKAIVDGDFVNKSALEAIVLANGTNSLTLAANAAAATSNLTVTGGTGADTVNATVLGKSVTIDGGNGNDVLIGSNQIDSILGGAGDDSITGGLLADSLNGGEGSDTYIYASNADFITGGAVVDSINDAGATGTDRALISGAISIVRTDSLAGAIGVDQLVAATDATALHHSIVINNNSALQNVRTIDLSGSNNSGSSSVVTLANAAYNAVVGAVTDGVDLTSPEVTTFTLTQVMNAGQSLTINGRTVTATDNGNTAGQLAEAFRTGVSGAGLTVSGAFNTPAGWTGVPADWTGAPGVTGAGATIIFTNTVDGDVTTQFTASTGSAASALTTGVTVIGVLNGTNDFIGSDGNDTLTGGAGADTINGGAGNDTIVGGAGNDLVNYDSGDISVDGGNDTDTLTAADVTGGPVSIDLASTTDAFANFENIIGSIYNDILTGDANGNSIDGGAGADLITGGAGNDTFTGGTGVDTFLFSNASNGVEVDTITDWGIENGDKLSGSMGAGDQLNVQFGSQTSFIDNDVTVVSQGTGGSASVVEFNDHYDVGDVVTLTIAGLSISRPVKAGATSGYDVALSFEDVLDNITLNTIDADLVNGTSASSVTQLGTNGGGQLRIANDSGENGVFTVTKAVTNASGIVFDAYEDGTVGIAAVNGVVSVIGGVGDDTITGGIGNDTITGALGDDTFNVISGTDTITDLSGFDVLKVSVGATANAAVTANFVATGATSNAGTANLTLSNDVDVDLVLAGGGVGYTITASGNVAASSIFGSQDADTITGGLGNDLIWGASGNDILTGGNGDDTFGGDQGDDTVTGGSGNDFFVVNFGTDAITDFGGSDVLTVGGGATANAAVTANFVATVATSNAGTANLTLSNDVDVDLHLAVGGVGYTITASGNAADTIVGSLYADTITGGTGSDAITGGAGNDIITGGAGVDSLDGGDGADTFRFADRAEIVGDATIVGGNLIDTIVITAQVTSALDLGNEANIATVESLTLALGSTATVTLDAQMTDATITSGAADITLSAVGQDVDGAANGVLTVRSTVANVANSIIKGDNATGDTLVIIDQVVAPLDLGAYADLQGVESLTLALGSTATVTLDAQMTSVTVTSGAADITLSAAGQNVTSTAAASDTVRTGLLATVSGNLALGAGGTDVLIISNTANISTATTTEVEEIHLAINVGATMTVAQDDKISSANATGNNTVTLTDVATAAHQLSAGVETYVLAAGANSVTSGVASQTINADALTDAQVLTLAGTHNVTVTLVAGDLTSTSSGNLTVTATTGSNVITTGIGADTITGGAGVDNMNGGDGADVFIIAAAADHAAGETILGGLLTDVIRFTSTAAGTLTLDANVTVEEARITDAAGVATGVTAENINATNAVGTIALYGNDGNNQLTGNGSANVMSGGAGADTITGGAGADNMDGGDGADVFVIAAAADHAAGETILGGLLTDVIRFTSTAAGTLTLDANVTVEEARITDAAGVATGVTAENINATNAVGTIALYGNDGNNQLTGNASANTISGGLGADTITGGAGADSMDGGAGTDVFIIALAADHAAGETIFGGTETDVIRFTSTAAGTLSLTSNVTVEEARITDAAGVATGTTAENIDATNAVGTIALYGNDGNNQLTGNGSANVMSGGAGADNMDGGIGADVFVVAVAGDFAAGETVTGGTSAHLDTIRLDDAGAYGNTVLSATVSGVELITLNENAASFDLTFAAGAFVGGDVNADGAATENTLEVSSAIAMTNGVRIDASAAAATSELLVTGTNLGGDDTLIGGAGNDAISGGSGIDIITGGAGADTISGGLGADTFVYGATITDSNISTTVLPAAGFDVVQVDATDTFDFSAAVLAVVGAPIAHGGPLDTNGTAVLGQLNTAFTAFDDGIANVEAGVITFNSGEQFLVVDSNADQTITSADQVVQLIGIAVTNISLSGGNVDIN